MYGTHAVDVRICACPVRDKKTLEDKQTVCSCVCHQLLLNHTLTDGLLYHPRFSSLLVLHSGIRQKISEATKGRSSVVSAAGGRGSKHTSTLHASSHHTVLSYPMPAEADNRVYRINVRAFTCLPSSLLWIHSVLSLLRSRDNRICAFSPACTRVCRMLSDQPV